MIVLAKSNADTRALNAAMRDELRQAGRLSGQDIAIHATDRSRAVFDLPIARGDRVEIHVRNRDLGLVNGTAGTVTQIEEENSGHARLTLAVGSRSVTFSTREITDAKGRARIGHAYATTIHNAQGITVDRAIVVGNPSFSANQAYVAASRARERTDFVIDQRMIDSELRAKARATGHFLDRAPSALERKAHLAGRWARTEVRETARSMVGKLQVSQPVKSRQPELER
ncbi:MAG: hypothetical protein WCD70_08070 [Alphaproteobacteria bacterium]